MELSPIQFQLLRLDWSYFSTLTFGTGWSRVGEKRLNQMVFAWLHKVARFHRVKFEELLFAIRGEKGELNGRFHLHALLGFTQVPLQPNTKGTRFAMMSLWEGLGGGHPRIRAYRDDLKGVAYILKGLDKWSTLGEHRRNPGPSSVYGANHYESGKFDPESCDVMLGRAVVSLLAKRSTYRRRNLSAREFRAGLAGSTRQASTSA